MEKEENIIGSLKLIDSKINWGKGKNNYIYCDNTYGDVVLEKTNVTFNGSNALLYIVGGGKKTIKIKATLCYNSCIYIGYNTSFHKTASAHLATSEQASIIIGDDCMFSREVWVRTGDAHPIYSVETKQRVNYPKDIIIGDHIWIGQDVMILKGAIVGSGSILGARSLLTNKYYYSNSSYGGSPAKIISEEGSVFFDRTDLNSANKETCEKFETYDSDDYIYEYNKDTCIFEKLLNFLKDNIDPNARIEFFRKITKDKNRFALSSKEK